MLAAMAVRRPVTVCRLTTVGGSQRVARVGRLCRLLDFRSSVPGPHDGGFRAGLRASASDRPSGGMHQCSDPCSRVNDADVASGWVTAQQLPECLGPAAALGTGLTGAGGIVNVAAWVACVWLPFVDKLWQGLTGVHDVGCGPVFMRTSYRTDAIRLCMCGWKLGDPKQEYVSLIFNNDFNLHVL